MEEKIAKVFATYIKNWDEKKELDEKLLSSSKDEDWLEHLKKRAKRQQELYAENVEQLNWLLTYTREHALSLTEQEAKALYQGVMDMYYGDYDDFCLLTTIIGILAGHYRGKGEYSIMVDLMACSSYEKLELLSRESRNATQEDVMEDILAVIGYKAYFSKLETTAKRKIFTSYYNMIVVCLDSKIIDMDLSYYYLNELLAFSQMPFVSAFIESDERSKGVIERAKQEWLGFNEAVEEASIETKEMYQRLSEEFYQKELQKGIPRGQITYEIYVSHLTSKVLQGEETYASAFDLLMEYYEERRSYLVANRMKNDAKLMDTSYEYMSYLYFFINMPQTVLHWIKRHDIPREKYEHQLRIYLKDLSDVWHEMYQNLPAAFLDEFVMEVCVTLMAHMPEEEQKTWLNILMVKRHINTYIHCTMVAKMASMIANAMLQECPQVFYGIHGFCAKSGEAEKEELLTYIKECAYFHDIGKSRIGDIINTQTRKLWDFEFEIIKEHPFHGAEYAKQLPILKDTYDVILGHHKYYDGSKGYPMDFDNTKSGIRPIIDLVTICDCLDAATDIFGRNYVMAKNFHVVLEELSKEAGTRYNPKITEFLIQNEKLQEELSYLTGEGRVLICQKIYEEYLAEE